MSQGENVPFEIFILFPHLQISQSYNVHDRVLTHVLSKGQNVYIFSFFCKEIILYLQVCAYYFIFLIIK